MRRLASTIALLATVVLAACAPASRPAEVPVSSSEAADQEMQPTQRMAAALQRFADENPAIRDSLGEVAALRAKDIEVVGSVPVERIIKFIDGDRVVYGLWSTYNDEVSGTGLIGSAKHPEDYPKGYFDRVVAIYGSTPMTAAAKASFIQRFQAEYDGNYAAWRLDVAKSGQASIVEIHNVLRLASVEGAPISEGVNWTYDPVADRVLSISLDDMTDY